MADATETKGAEKEKAPQGKQIEAPQSKEYLPSFHEMGPAEQGPSPEDVKNLPSHGYKGGGLAAPPLDDDEGNDPANEGAGDEDAGIAPVPEGMPERKYLKGKDASKMLKANPEVQKVLYARLESLDKNDIMALDAAITPQTGPVLAKVFPELSPMILVALQRKQKMAQSGAGAGGPAGAPGKPGANGPGPNMPTSNIGSAPQGPQQGAGGKQAATQVAPTKISCMLTMAHGGFVKPLKGQNHFSNAGMPIKTGMVNKGIPNSGFARGGIAAAPHAASLSLGEEPALRRQNSREYNRPMKTGGMVDPTTYANGGYIPNGNYAAGGMPADPNADQGMPHLAVGGLGAPPGPQSAPPGPASSPAASVANQAVPSAGTADQVPAKLSKGEFVMDAATVQYFGAKKFLDMQNQAHEKMAEHLAQQDQAQQHQDQQGPQGQGQPPQQPSQGPPGLAAPKPQPAPQAPPSGPQPDATQQRIQATNTPHPAQNPLSMS